MEIQLKWHLNINSEHQSKGYILPLFHWQSK